MLKSVFRTTQFKKDFKVLLKKHYSPDKLKQAMITPEFLRTFGFRP